MRLSERKQPEFVAQFVLLTNQSYGHALTMQREANETFKESQMLLRPFLAISQRSHVQNGADRRHLPRLRNSQAWVWCIFIMIMMRANL